MIHPEALIKLFTYTYDLTLQQTMHITHEQSLTTTPLSVNCINWLVGHIISARTRAHVLLNTTPVWSNLQRQVYKSGSLPIDKYSSGIIQLDVLRGDLKRSQLILIQRLRELTYNDMCEPSGYKNNTNGDSLAYFQFHEAHHVGQILFLAPLLGLESVWLEP